MCHLYVQLKTEKINTHFPLIDKQRFKIYLSNNYMVQATQMVRPYEYIFFFHKFFLKGFCKVVYNCSRRLIGFFLVVGFFEM